MRRPVERTLRSARSRVSLPFGMSTRWSHCVPPFGLAARPVCRAEAYDEPRHPPVPARRRPRRDPRPDPPCLCGSPGARPALLGYASAGVGHREAAARGRGSGDALAGRYIGTITVRPPQPDSSVALYRDPAVYSLAQFCVAPRFKGQGLGRRLHDHAVEVACERGARTIALDTARPATALIRLYEAWGYAVVGECDWRPHTNYVSVLMARPTGPGAMR